MTSLRSLDAVHLPAGPGRVAVVAAVAMWAGAMCGALVSIGRALALAGCACLVALGFGSRRGLVLLVAAVGLVSGALAADRAEGVLEAAIPQGPGALHGTATTDSLVFGDRVQFVLKPGAWRSAGGGLGVWTGPPIQVVADAGDVVAGDLVVCHGVLRQVPGFVRGDPVAGRFTADDVQIISSAAQPVVAAGNLLRSRVQSRVSSLGESAAAALLSGFLIGDIESLPSDDEEALRRAGLTHYVAVSGSNVALVLGAWWLVVGPLGAGTRVRAATGLIVLLVFVVATRWESSVIRAATMAGLVLGGKAVGIPLDAWTSLGAAVTILLAVSGELALDVGFQLSVAATSGVLLGMRWWGDRSPRVFWAALSATVGAQLAVIPLLLVHFGTVPLLSPVANLVAAPLVTVATSLAGLGVIVNWDLPLALAEQVASWFLTVARLAGDWPQLSLLGVVGVGLLAAVAMKVNAVPLLAIGAVVLGSVSAVPPGPPSVPTITFLDVGQGDAVLLLDPSGASALIDGGADPGVLRRSLRRHGVGRIDLLVASHGDSDHVGGLQGIEQSLDVGRLWVPAGQEVSALLGDLIEAVGMAGVGVDEVGAGETARLGEFDIRVVGPRRRYAAENDGSVVLMVEAGGVSVLLAGDAGAIAQGELPSLRPDVLLVPHHGAATTDLDWLEETVGRLAVISSGENSYGHPTPEVIATLEAAGAEIRSTVEIGDVVVPMTRDPAQPAGVGSTLVGP